MNKKALAVALTFCSAPFACVAAGNDPWEAPFLIQIGAMSADATTSLRLDSNSGAVGTEVSFESDLNGQKRKTVPSIDLAWRFNPRHAIEGSWVSLRRDGDATFEGELHWGEVTFPFNSTLRSSFDSDIYRIAYRWSFVHDERTELGLLLGLHYTQMKTSISTVAGTISQEASVKYPLPTFGLRGSTQIAENWRLSGFGQFLKLKIGDYDGELLNFGAGIEWAFSRDMLLGAGYDYYKYNLTSTKDDKRGEFDYRFDGPRLYFGWSFR